MSADIEQWSGIEVLATAKPLDFAFFAFTSSIAPVLHLGRAVADPSRSRAGEHEQVIGEHPEPDPPLHPAGASVATPPQSVTSFACADASLAACAPAQRCARRPRARLPPLARHPAAAA